MRQALSLSLPAPPPGENLFSVLNVGDRPRLGKNAVQFTICALLVISNDASSRVRWAMLSTMAVHIVPLMNKLLEFRRQLFDFYT
jgi:hypothetical protein